MHFPAVSWNIFLFAVKHFISWNICLDWISNGRTGEHYIAELVPLNWGGIHCESTLTDDEAIETHDAPEARGGESRGKREFQLVCEGGEGGELVCAVVVQTKTSSHT